MKAITAQDFAQLCRNDPDIHNQMLAIPKTVTAEKIFALAERNGYRIPPKRNRQPHFYYNALKVLQPNHFLNPILQQKSQAALHLHTHKNKNCFQRRFHFRRIHQQEGTSQKLYLP